MGLLRWTVAAVPDQKRGEAVLREAFRAELDGIVGSLVEMTKLVGSAMSRATTALLDSDLQTAEGVITDDLTVDQLYREVEERRSSCSPARARSPATCGSS